MKTIDLILKADATNLISAFEKYANLIEIELAERSLKRNLFGIYGSSDFARLVAGEVVSLVRLSIVTGNLNVYQQQIEWEIGVAMSHHQLFKLQTDTAIIDTLEQILLEHFASELHQAVTTLANQLRTMYEVCWYNATQKQATTV